MVKHIVTVSIPETEDIEAAEWHVAVYSAGVQYPFSQDAIIDAAREVLLDSNKENEEYCEVIRTQGTFRAGAHSSVPMGEFVVGEIYDPRERTESVITTM